MRLTILVDNNTLIDRYFRAEPGLSLLIEDHGLKILFDTGYSDLFLENAAKMGKDLSNLDFLAISHSHLDHTWGLDPLVRYFTTLAIENRKFKRPVLVAHPQVFESAGTQNIPELGSLVSEEKAARHMTIKLSKTPVQLGPNLIFLGQIPRKNDFEGNDIFGQKQSDQPDMVMDDTALVYRSRKGLVIITGCSHSGICNIIEHAKSVCHDNRVADIVGGLHLLNPSSFKLDSTVKYLKALAPKRVHACHCTDLASKIALAGVVNLKEVGVGLTLCYDEPDME